MDIAITDSLLVSLFLIPTNCGCNWNVCVWYNKEESKQSISAIIFLHPLLQRDHLATQKRSRRTARRERIRRRISPGPPRIAPGGITESSLVVILRKSSQIRVHNQVLFQMSSHNYKFNKYKNRFKKSSKIIERLQQVSASRRGRGEDSNKVGFWNLRTLVTLEKEETV